MDPMQGSGVTWLVILMAGIIFLTNDRIGAQVVPPSRFSANEAAESHPLKENPTFASETDNAEISATAENLKKTGFFADRECLRRALFHGMECELKPVADSHAGGGSGLWMINRAQRYGIKYVVWDDMFIGTSGTVANYSGLANSIYLRSRVLHEGLKKNSGVIAHELQHAVHLKARLKTVAREP
jgi:hypothetical protein